MSGDEKKAIGRILLARRLVSQETLDRALHDHEEQPLASFLTDNGSLKAEDGLRALSEQLGVPGIDLSQVAIDVAHLEFVPRGLAEARRMLPVLAHLDRLFLAMSDPTDKKIIDELEFVSGRRVHAYVALRTSLDRAISGAYDARDRGEPIYAGPSATRDAIARAHAAALRPSIPASSGSAPPSAASPIPSSLDVPSLVLDEPPKASAAKAIALDDAGASDLSLLVELTPEARGDAAPPASSEPPGAPPRASGVKTVLVVDDEDDIRRMLRRVLTEKGYRVIEADRGLLALRLVKEHVPDLIILDAMLPELHGFDIARRIKGSEKYGHIPVIMISAVYRGWRIVEDLKASYGIHAYLEKPFRIQDIVAAVGRGLSERAAAAERDLEAISAEANDALEQGVRAYRAGQLDEAIACLLRGVQLDPLAYRLHFHLALLYGRRGNVYEGIQALEKAIELHPKHFPALKNLGLLYEKAGFRHKALEMWERCVHAAPDAEARAQMKEHLLSLL